MHERALVSKTAIELASLAGQDRLSSVTLAVSPETDPTVVEEAWRSVTAGTSIGGVSLEVVVEEHGLQCLDCAARYQGSKLTFCPTCGGNGLIVDPTPEVALGAWLVGETV